MVKGTCRSSGGRGCAQEQARSEATVITRGVCVSCCQTLHSSPFVGEFKDIGPGDGARVGDRRVKRRREAMGQGAGSPG